MKHYLIKIAEFTGAKTLRCFNEKNLSMIEIWRDSEIEINVFDDLEDLKENYNYCIKHDYKLSNKKTFDDAYIEFIKKLNQLAKEL